MEIRPASLAQMAKGRNGHMVEIQDDVQGVANSLAAIDPHIRLRFSEAGGYFVAYWLPDDGEEGDGYLITTAQDLDMRLVKRIEEVYWRCRQRDYSYAGEIDKTEVKAQAQKDHEWAQKNGELVERLAYALREGTNRNQHKAYIGKEIPA